MDIGEIIKAVLIISTLYFILKFLVFREFFCWYYKINRRIDMMQMQIELLKQMRDDMHRTNDILTFMGNEMIEMKQLNQSSQKKANLSGMMKQKIEHYDNLPEL